MDGQGCPCDYGQQAATGVRYRKKVQCCLDLFARMLRESRFDTEPRQVGLEIEVNLVDERRPALR